jgi:putative ABC transport system permease protein
MKVHSVRNTTEVSSLRRPDIDQPIKRGHTWTYPSPDDRLITAMVDEIRTAARRLLEDRWFAAAAVLVAALGTGLNTAVFTIAYGVLIRPLPYRDPGRLAVTQHSIAIGRLDDWRAQLSTFDRLAASTRLGFTVRGLGEPRFVPVAVVDDAFFETLGGAALSGRTFGTADSAPVAVVSARLARQAGLTAADVPGRNVIVGDRPLTVIGVMPAAFGFPSEGIEAWIPARVAPGIAFDRSSDQRRFRLVGRLKPGVPIAAARDDLARAAQQLEPGTKPPTESLRVTSLYDALVGETRPVVLAFIGAAVLVLLVACANIATILIGRTVARRRELAIRSALGASCFRLFVTIFSESILIALSGAVLGTALALVGVRLFVRWAEGILPRLADVSVDWRLLACVMGVAAFSAIAAVTPALRFSRGESLGVRPGAGGTPGRVRVRAILAVSQIALAVLLLSAGVLLTRTIVALLHADNGVEPRGVIVSQWILTNTIRFDALDKQGVIDRALERVRGIPGIVAAGAGSSLPPDNATITLSARLVGPTGTTRIPGMSLTAVTPGYLEALGVRLLKGRVFESADTLRSDLVTVLSESAARALMPGVDPIGRPLPIDLPASMRQRGRATVLGVVSDVKYSGLESAAEPGVYVLWKELPAGQIYLAARSRGNALAAAPMLRAGLHDVDPDIPLMPIRRLDEVMQRSVADRRLRALLGGSVGLLAVAIALVGVAGGLARMVTERRRELAIRAALGATPARALRSVLSDGAIVTAGGIGAGLLMTLAAGRTLQSLVFGVSPHDPVTLMAVALSVGAGALLACYLPARRAAATNPLDMLREE